MDKYYGRLNQGFGDRSGIEYFKGNQKNMNNTGIYYKGDTVDTPKARAKVVNDQVMAEDDVKVVFVDGTTETYGSGQITPANINDDDSK